MDTKLQNYGLFDKIVGTHIDQSLQINNAYIAFSWLGEYAGLNSTDQRLLYAYMERYIRVQDGRYQESMGGQKYVWEKYKRIRCPESYLMKILRDRSERTIRRSRTKLIDAGIISTYDMRMELSSKGIIDTAKYVEINQDVLDVYHLFFLWNCLQSEEYETSDVQRFCAIASRLGQKAKSLIISIGQKCPSGDKILDSTRTKNHENVLVSRTKIGKNVLVKELYMLITNTCISNSEGTEASEQQELQSVSISDSIESSSSKKSPSFTKYDLWKELDSDSKREMKKYMKDGAINIHLWHRILFFQITKGGCENLKMFLENLNGENLPNYDMYERVISKHRFFHSFTQEPEEVWMRFLERLNEFDFGRRRSFKKLISDFVKIMHEEMIERRMNPEDKLSILHYSTYLNLIPEKFRTQKFLEASESWFDYCSLGNAGRMSYQTIAGLMQKLSKESEEVVIDSIYQSISSSWRTIILPNQSRNGNYQSHTGRVAEKNRAQLSLRDEGSNTERSQKGAIDLASRIRDLSGEKHKRG